MSVLVLHMGVGLWAALHETLPAVIGDYPVDVCCLTVHAYGRRVVLISQPGSRYYEASRTVHSTVSRLLVGEHRGFPKC